MDFDRFFTPMIKYLLCLSYDGRPFCGWQRQTKHTSVQQTVENALTILLKHPVKLQGAGRTDAHVHARNQWAHFTTEQHIHPHKLLRSLNALTPVSIACKHLQCVEETFCAVRSAQSKVYRYTVQTTPWCCPLTRHQRLHDPRVTQRDAIDKAMAVLAGTHHFQSFTNHGSSQKSYVRTLLHVAQQRHPEHVVWMFHGTGFLYKMCRNLSGLLLAVGRGAFDVDAIQPLLEQKNRAAAPATAPAHGLMLWHVQYPFMSEASWRDGWELPVHT